MLTKKQAMHIFKTVTIPKGWVIIIGEAYVPKKSDLHFSKPGTTFKQLQRLCKEENKKYLACTEHWRRTIFVRPSFLKCCDKDGLLNVLFRA